MSNETIAVVTFLGLGFSILIFLRLGRPFLFAFSSFIIVASNATVGIEAVVFGIPVSLGVIIYSLIYLITDILSETYEKNAAYKLAISNLLVQVLFWAYIFINIPVSVSFGQEVHENMVNLYSATPRITVAALVASLGAFADIWIYETVHRVFRDRTDFLGTLWFRNNLSTIIGQSINTTLFFGIALYGVLPNLPIIILGAIGIKVAIALFDTPFLYLAKAIHRTGIVRSDELE